MIVILFACIPGFAQEELNSAEVNSKSYQLYMDKNWEELITFGREALKAGQDFFYLRMRLGIAFYEKGEFRKATEHFQKAQLFNASDELLMEYLYYSLLFSNRPDDARKLSLTFSGEFNSKINASSGKSTAGIGWLEIGSKVSNRPDLFGAANYIQAGIGHTVKKKFSLLHAGTIFNQSEHRGKIGQLQYFIQANIPLKNNWSIAPSLHVVNLVYQVGNSRTIYLDYAASLSVTKSWPHADISVGGTITNVGTSTQVVQQTRLALYPFGTPGFSLGAIGYLHTENGFTSVTAAINPFIFLGSRKLKFYAYYLSNQKSNMVEQNGYLINNSPDLTVSRTSMLLSLSLTKRLDIYGVYQFENKQDVNLLSYTYNIYLGGFKFTF